MNAAARVAFLHEGRMLPRPGEKSLTCGNVTDLWSKDAVWLSNGAADGEVVFPRCDQAELGQPADFRRKSASLDAELVRELLAVE